MKPSRKQQRLSKSLIIIGLLLCIAVACVALMDSAALFTPLRAQIELSGLRKDFDQVPHSSESVLLQRIEDMSPSRVDRCSTVHIRELRATNAASMPDILRMYRAMLPADVVKTETAREKLSIYQTDELTTLAISNLVEDRGFQRDIVKNAIKSYRTVFVVGLSRPVYRDRFAERCR